MKKKKFTQFAEVARFMSEPGKLRKPGKLCKLPSICFMFFVICSLFFTGQLMAKITGNCSNCHTMHNSQGGEPMIILGPGETDTAPKSSLLKASCLGCHSKTDGNTWKDPITGAPIVFNSQQPSYNSVMGLAGGNFYWVQTEDVNGHNIFPNNPDNILTVAPGAVTTSCGTNSCHDNLHGINTNFGTRQGCSKCHMMGNSNGPTGYHHKNNTTTEPLVDSADKGWYRFLDGHMSGSGSGVTGVEDSDWQATAAVNDHNEYLGFSGTKTSAGGFSSLDNTVTAYCTGCHGNFHIEQDASSVWIRHPSDGVVPNSGEFAAAFGASGGTGTYDPLIPVARPSLTGWTGPASTVTLGTDLVMCLSCHRAHASPYFKMVRWDYKSATLSTALSGCLVCHTSKN